MYIESFRIDGFGIFSGVQVDSLPPGLSIFLGRNEAGKSTCLEFLRSMLTGYPDPRSREARHSYAPLRGGQPGGGLVLRADGREPLHLTRRPGAGGGLLTLSEADGSMLPPELLRQLLFGVSREVYRNVFGFSLSELENFESLSTEGVRNALYGASFGPGLRAPGDVLKILERQAEDIFKSGGSKPALNTAIRQLEELRDKIEDVAAECAGFDGMALELSHKKTALADLRRRKSDLEEERRLLERRLGVWRQWDEWRMAGIRLERLTPVNENFPEDGPARLARIQEARETCERQLAAHREKTARLRERHDAVLVEQRLLDALPELRRLSERKSGYRQAQSLLSGQEDNCRRAEADLNRELTRLGPGWNCERIRATDRSLFAREDLEKQAREMAAADSAHQAAVDALTKANRDVETAERDVAAAQSALALLPAPVAALGDEARDDLRQTLARLEEGRRQLPGRQRALHNARTTFARAYDPLRLAAPGGAPGNGGNNGPRDILDGLLARQDEALTLAGEVQERLREASEASQAVQQAEEQVEAVKNRMEDLRDAQRNASGPSREALDARAAALRSLRALSASMATERERLQELDNRINSEQAPSPVKSLPLIVVGALLIAAGLGILLAYWRWGLTSLPLTGTLALPVSLWSGYLVLACGVGFLAGGLPRSGPEAKRHQREMAQLQNRRETCALHVAELGEQARQLCAAAGVDSMDLVTLEATEMLLEREREQCFNEERSRRDMEGLKREMGLAKAQVGVAQARAHEAESVVQQTRRRWHELMLALRVSNVPSPESAAAFFARAESARLAFGGVAAAEAELHALEDDLRGLEERMRAVPAVAERLTQEADCAALVECVRQVLESCREADAAREQRIKAAAALQNHENELERAGNRQREASEQLRAAEERLGVARETWSLGLQGLGLGEDLDPETVREAFKYMENCLAAESALERARTELAQGRAELAALREPLAALLASLSRDPLHDADGAPDWLASLDAALAAAEAMAQSQDERTRLSGLLAEEEDEVRAGEAALSEARNNERNLLALAGAHDAEDFLRLAALRDEQQALARRRQDLEDALRLAADTLPLPEFLASFREEEQESQEKRSAAIQEELNGILDEEQELATAVAGLSAKVAALARADDLAELRQQEALLLESMQRMALAWSRRALAREILLNAKRIFERERQPEVIRQASDIFARITNRRWRGISASLENSSLSILPDQGEAVPPESLSRGTQEQAYLALRLAYIKNHAAHAAPLPVIMDEVLVNFDPERAERTARAFAELADGREGPAHQLLYFTCQPHMVDVLRAAEPGAALFKVENGTITAG
ncbi:AAA family ATPase [Desulfovibrio porci]|uniref:AAA family ATPase n=1 Tax=Desulfovibrio porci TaxID=2605782 RepID=UPI002A83C8C4|nr:AAA family ATPase [Desulfovibrio porci]MDY3810077.1 AAA family ATPase [Desulfovibrio porci]